MTETELEYQFCFNCNDRKNCYTKPKDCTRIKEEIGLQDMTNEEWLHTLNTEQLANVLFEYRYINATPQQQLWLSANEDFVKGGIVEWLKQPHTVKE